MVDQHARRLLPYALIVAIISVSTASIFIRFAQQDAPSIVIAAVRLTFACILLAPVAIFRYRSELLSLTRCDLLLGLLAGLFLALHFATWITSLEYTSIASSVVLVSTGPLWVALLSPFLLREPLSKIVFWGLVLSMVGGTIISISDSCTWQAGLVCPSFSTILQGRSMLGNLLALSGALTVSGYLLIGRRLRSRLSLVPYIFVVYCMAAFILILIMLFSRQTPFGYSRNTYTWLFLLALIPQIIGHSTFNWTLRYLPATLVAVATLGEPVGSSILAFLIFHEEPGIIKAGGAILILIGILFATRVQGDHE
jgi:drug/metabolite transporter (DMT)-like permease